MSNPQQQQGEESATTLLSFASQEQGVVPLSPDEMEFLQMLKQVLNNLKSEKSKRTYAYSARTFFAWLRERGYTPRTMQRKEALEYREWLFSKEQDYATSTSNRLLSVASTILEEYVLSRILQWNPFTKVKGEPVSDESPHVALTGEQVRALLELPDRETQMGLRDYAILSLLVKTGMRRSECAGINVGDVTMEQGYHMVWITRKGGKRDFIRLRAEVFLAIQDYMERCHRKDASPDAPLFVQCDPGGHPTTRRLSDDGIYHVVRVYAEKLALPPQPNGRRPSPHGVGRATAITFLLEAGVPWERIMEVTGQKNAETMLRYNRRRAKLKESAVEQLNY